MITLLEGTFGWDYIIQCDTGEEILIQSDWDFPATASTFGWSPCSRCRKSCKGESDGTVDCARRSAFEHVMEAQAWLDRHIGATANDPGYFN